MLELHCVWTTFISLSWHTVEPIVVRNARQVKRGDLLTTMNEAYVGKLQTLRKLAYHVSRHLVSGFAVFCPISNAIENRLAVACGADSM